jgi:hypothetical protein
MAHKTEEELLEKLNEARTKVTFGGTYKHYKDPAKHYKVQGFVILESTDSVGIIYQAQYSQRLTFVRPLGSWLAEVEHEGKTVPRFKEVQVRT